MNRFFDIQFFADAGTLTNATTQYVNSYTGDVTSFSGVNTLSPTMKTYYDTELLENARPNLFFAQFAKRQGLPANRGRTVEWRKWNTLPNASVLTEGVIPTGEKLGMTSMTVPLVQSGMYVTVSDLLDLHAVDDVVLGATEELGASMGNTKDVFIRNKLSEGTSVLYCDIYNGASYVSTPTSRAGITANAKLTPTMVNRAATFLKKMKAPTINGKYIAIIHPSVAYDLRQSSDWIDVHKYAQPIEIYNGEIGELHGVRFIETTNARIHAAAPIAGMAGLNVTAVKTAVTSDDDVVITDAIDATQAAAATAAIAAGNNKVYIGGTEHTIASVTAGTAGTAVITLAAAATISANAVVSGLGAGADGSAVYETIFLGKDAYGIIDPDGGSSQMIVHNRSEIGGPLDQFSTVGYKMEDACKILYQERMLRVESGSFYSDVDESN